MRQVVGARKRKELGNRRREEKIHRRDQGRRKESFGGRYITESLHHSSDSQSPIYCLWKILRKSFLDEASVAGCGGSDVGPGGGAAVFGLFTAFAYDLLDAGACTEDLRRAADDEEAALFEICWGILEAAAAAAGDTLTTLGVPTSDLRLACCCCCLSAAADARVTTAVDTTDLVDPSMGPAAASFLPLALYSWETRTPFPTSAWTFFRTGQDIIA